MESMQNNKFDHKVKSKFEDFTSPVPSDLWNKIEDQLDASRPNKVKPLKKVRLLFLFYGAVAATILIAFVFWKFGDAEDIQLKGNPKVYASKDSFEKNESEQGNKRDGKQDHKESLSKVDHIVAVKSPIKVIEKKIPISQIEEANLPTETGLENSIKEVDYSTMHVESIFSLPVSEVPTAMEGVLPLEDQVIALQESTPLQEDFQGRLTEEVTTSKSKRIGVSTVLNFLAKGLANENGNSIEFSESEEGILKLDLKFGFAKSND